MELFARYVVEEQSFPSSCQRKDELLKQNQIKM